MERVSTPRSPKTERPPKVCPHCGRADCQMFLRSQKGKGVKPVTHQDRIGQALRNELNAIVGDLNRINSLWGREVSSGVKHLPLAEIIYHSEPFAGAYLEASRRLGDALDKAVAVPRLKFPPALTQQDHYRGIEVPLRGIGLRGPSPRDINNLPLPLDNEGIGKIDSLMKATKIGPFIFGDPRAAFLLEVLPIQPLARPELKLTIPQGLQPLNSRMLAYYDYYMGFFAVPNLDPIQETKGFIRMAWLGGGLMTAIACYIPARLGITPSSAFKLYQEKTLLSDQTFSGRRWQRIIGRETELSFRKNALPPHLQRYQHLDKAIDKKAAEALKFKYNSHDGVQKSDSDNDKESNEALRSLARYRADLRSEALKSSDKYLRLSIDPEGIIRDVIIASQNRQTLMLIIEIADGSYVTLEANNNSRLFGIPPQLRREYPHIEDLLIRDAVVPVLDWAKPRFPHIEPKVTRSTPATLQKLPDAETYKESLSATPEQVVIKPPKKKTLRSAIQKAVTREPVLPQPAQERRRIRRVIATRAKIEKLLPKNTSADIVDRALSAIQDFEFGDRRAKALVDFPDTYRITVGRYRIILEKGDYGIYSLEDVGHRREIYRDYT